MIAYERGTATVQSAVALHPLGADVTNVAMNGDVELTPPRVGYCFRGQFLNLSEGQPRRDSSLRGATIANFIAGEGISCSQPPPGFTRRGTATAAMGVPPGIYPYYAP